MARRARRRIAAASGYLYISLFLIPYLMLDCVIHAQDVVRREAGACELLPDRGSCRESHLRFFYNASAGNCSVFLYGGCLGNGNNFPSLEQCQSACSQRDAVSAATGHSIGGRSRLLLPWQSLSFSGPSDDQLFSQRVLTTSSSGNRQLPAIPLENFDGANNLLVSSGAFLLDDCQQAPQRGFCSGFIPRWYYHAPPETNTSATTPVCRLFYYSGCGGNGNNFATRDLCQERCTVKPFSRATIGNGQQSISVNGGSHGSTLDAKAACLSKPLRGNCRSALIRWYYDFETQRCSEFVFSGCNGNENNYPSQQECQQRCIITGENAIPAPGADPDAFRLRRINLNALGGSGMPFGPSPANVLFPGARPATEAEQSPDLAADQAGARAEAPNKALEANRNSAVLPQRCIMEMDRGPCVIDMERWYYDTRTSTCRPFYYGGCMGNENRFSSRRDCEANCATSGAERIVIPNVNSADMEACILPPATGSCRSAFRRLYYDFDLGQCKEFIYGGCDGNANNFRTVEECQVRCGNMATSLQGGGRRQPEVQENRPQLNSPRPLDGAGAAKCRLPADEGPCKAYFPMWFFNGQRCDMFPWGGCEGNANKFETEEQCQMECGAAGPVPGDRRNVNLIPPTTVNALPRTDLSLNSGSGSVSDVCRQPPDSGPCPGNNQRYFYDTTVGFCKAFSYGGCGGNLNNFRTSAECQTTCRAVNFREAAANGSLAVPTICTYPATRGPCRAFIPAYFHDVRDGLCKMFYYGGCQGNENRFQSRPECEKICTDKDANELVPGNVGLGSVFDRVHINALAGPGGNSFGPSTAARSNICSLPAEPGRCLAMIPSFFYDQQTGQCRQFIYGGCLGNANRFSSLEECQSFCIPQAQSSSTGQLLPQPNTRSANPGSNANEVTRKNPDCLLSLETGPCRGNFRMWGFDISQQACIQFTYGGCAGNSNRFNQREACMEQCASLIVSDKANMMRLQQLQLPPQSGGTARSQGQSPAGLQDSKRG